MQAAAVVVSAVVPGGDTLVKVAELIGELRGSKPMFEGLLKHLQEVEPRLRKVINSNAVREKEALRQYEKLVTDLHAVLERHLKRNSFSRFAGHWSLKDAVQQFKTQLELVKDLMDLDRELNIMNYFEQVRQFNHQASDAQAAAFASLQVLIESQPTEFAQLIKQEKVTVADLIDFKSHIKENGDAYSKEELEALLTALKDASNALGVKLPHISSWYMSVSEIVYDNGDPFATSEHQLRALYAGTIIPGSKVTVKTARASNNPTDIELFNKQAKMWYDLRHPHVLPLYGANHSGDPLLLVMGRAELGNFREYLATHRHRVWSLFLDAARGLAYLHKNKITHNNLKCNNLLVTAEGVGVVSDFLFAFVRTSSVMSVKPQAPSYHWKAPECFNPTNPNGRHESDVYALGMCLFEAFTGSAPYADVDEDKAIEMIKQGKLPAVPASVNMPTEAMELIQGMCRAQFTCRVKLDVVIRTLEVLAARERVLNGLMQCNCASSSCCACHRSIRQQSTTTRTLPHAYMTRSDTM
ncbi:hypothetical protein Poli38472_006911 [Pythium oligandrum]|uniref:Protein kinase domain-containing protein n=1 Tax=Pythium oligandrum TaxID=41045 RepID=A0A8K1C8Z5_PYTOL|nr:hypothetical protein Poli38472_006907 [Pythium oligandrum]TMW58766.1 hypothetical protein Poli38472_006911 [Pythium oligandrum]|eukprot:TMW58762.1 hypothetical protein Poli38472_006907 [Pythium oligandrum]